MAKCIANRNTRSNISTLNVLTANYIMFSKKSKKSNTIPLCTLKAIA